MNTATATRTALLLLATTLVACSSAPPPQHPASSDPGHASEKRALGPADVQQCQPGSIDVKFRAGSGVRLRDGRLTVVEEAATAPADDDELEDLGEAIGGFSRYRFARMFPGPEAQLEATRREGERSTGEPQPDLDLWYRLSVDPLAPEKLAQLINAVNRFEVVEIASCTPAPVPMTPPPPPPGT